MELQQKVVCRNGASPLITFHRYNCFSEADRPCTVCVAALVPGVHVCKLWGDSPHFSLHFTFWAFPRILHPTFHMCPFALGMGMDIV